MSSSGSGSRGRSRRTAAGAHRWSARPRRTAHRSAPPGRSSARRRRTPRRSSCGTCPTGPRPRSTVGDLRRAGPDVLEVDIVAVVVGAERLGVEVDVHRAGERVGDTQRRRREVVHLHVGVDPALEVAVARQHRDDREVGVVDDLGDLGRQRAAVADAGRAAVADEVEAELVEVLGQSGAVEVLGHDLRARRQRGLHPRLDLQALLHGVAGEQAGAEHHRGVGGVGAARDRRDHDVAVVELGLGAVGERQLGLQSTRRRWYGWRPGRWRGTIRRAPRPRRSRWAGSPGRRARTPASSSSQRHAVLGPLRPGDARHDGREVELQHVGVGRLLRVLVVPQAVGLGVGLDQLDLLVAGGR